MDQTGRLVFLASIVASFLAAFLICFLVIRYGLTRTVDPAGKWGWRPTRVGRGVIQTYDAEQAL